MDSIPLWTLRLVGSLVVVVAGSLALQTNGQAKVVAEGIQLPGGRTLAQPDFERHVQALLDRHGCNAGKCHGNRHGQGGFTLSLLAASPESDFLEITRRARGRYVNVADPEASLLLLKASGAAAHGGGARILAGSWEYAVLREWMAQGARRDAGRGEVKNLSVLPADRILQVGQTLPLQVVAEFADGTKEDVTPFCDFRLPASADEKAAPAVRVSDTGVVVADRPGDVGISVVYRGQVRILRARVAVPVAEGFVFPKVPEVNFIDTLVFGELRRLNIVPSDLSSDEQFLRRVYLDVVGTLPTPAEVRAFLASKDPDKRTKKIDELLAHPLHAAFLAIRFCELTGLIGSAEDAKAPRNKTAQLAHGWFRKRLQDNMPYDQIVAGVLTATSCEGRPQEEWLREKAALEKLDTGFGAEYAKRATLDIYWRHGGLPTTRDAVFGGAGSERKPTEEVGDLYLQEMAERTAAAFLGVNLECARCHVHPLAGWTPADQRGFANVFGQVRLEKVPLPSGTLAKWEQAAFARAVFLSDTPLQLKQPAVHERNFLAAVSTVEKAEAGTGAALKPRLLGGPEVDFRSDPRRTLVDWLRRPDNPYFARHFVNLMWQHYFGVSLVEGTDDLASAHGAAAHPVLERLAQEFVASKFDIRRLERTILLSRTYQLSSVPNESNKHERTHFARALPLRPGARVLTQILHMVLETSEDYGPGVPAGLHANEVAHLASAFLRQGYDNGYRERIARLVHQFGRGHLVSRCDNEPDLRSYLFTYGSGEVQRLLQTSKRIARLRQGSAQELDALVDETFLATLCRLPTATERKTATEYLQRDWGTNRQHVLENLFWALLNTREFIMRN